MEERENYVAGAGAVMMLDKLAPALCAAQGELKNPPKTKSAKISSTRVYQYADLAEVTDIVRPVLAKHRLALMHAPRAASGAMVYAQTLLHESGQALEAMMPIPDGLSPQEFGSWTTYMRRYMTAGLLFIAGEEDEDGAAANEAAEEAEREALDKRRAEAKAALDGLKETGKVRDAYTGKVLKPGEDVQPHAPDEKPSEPPPATEPGPSAGDFLAPELAKLMKDAAVTVAELKAYYVAAGHFADDMDPEALPEDYVEQICKPQNWRKVVKKIKG